MIVSTILSAMKRRSRWFIVSGSIALAIAGNRDVFSSRSGISACRRETILKRICITLFVADTHVDFPALSSYFPEVSFLPEAWSWSHVGLAQCDTLMGGIHLYRGNLEQASACFETAPSEAITAIDRANATMKLGELDLYRHDPASAETRFEEALRDNPKLEASVDALRKSIHSPQISP
jgi:tetratricopeptide (TPR) repeat protein